MSLRPFETSDLPAVVQWFLDAETQRWLGGPDWPELCLTLRSPMRPSYVHVVHGQLAGLLDIELYEDGRASFALVTAPRLRRQGVARAMLADMLDRPELNAVTEFFAGVERGNESSRRLVLGAGFVLVRPEDEDGFTYYARASSGRPASPWILPD